MAYTTIDKPSDYFRIKTYTGDSTDNRSITWDETDTNFGTNLLLWLKQRTVAAQEHYWVDSVRGAGVFLESDTTNAELTGTTAFDSLDTNGFTVDNAARTNRGTMVGWGWNTSGSASSNTDGSITSSVSANTTAGFSIVSYTGNGSASTIGHGLGVKPATIIIKARSKTGQNWIVWHQTFPNNNDYVELNTTDAKDTYDLFNNTAPTSSVFSVSSDGNVNSNTDTYIAYCFAEKKGYSKFGSYTGNGNADGTFIYTGFKPAFLIIKKTSASAPWDVFDNKRDVDNPVVNRLHPNNSDTEFAGSGYMDTDFLSNGFKLRTTDNELNTNGATFIYMCFASSPFTTSTGIPTTAR